MFYKICLIFFFIKLQEINIKKTPYLTPYPRPIFHPSVMEICSVVFVDWLIKFTRYWTQVFVAPTQLWIKLLQHLRQITQICQHLTVSCLYLSHTAVRSMSPRLCSYLKKLNCSPDISHRSDKLLAVSLSLSLDIHIYTSCSVHFSSWL